MLETRLAPGTAGIWLNLIETYRAPRLVRLDTNSPAYCCLVGVRDTPQAALRFPMCSMPTRIPPTKQILPIARSIASDLRPGHCAQRPRQAHSQHLGRPDSDDHVVLTRRPARLGSL